MAPVTTSSNSPIARFKKKPKKRRIESKTVLLARYVASRLRSQKATWSYSTARYLLLGGSASTRGARPYMEDRQRMETLPSGGYAAVYDGHNGMLAAEIAQQGMTRHLTAHEHLPANEMLLSAFEKMESEIITRTLAVGQEDGSTAVVAYFKTDDLYIANLGDCRAVLSSDNVGNKRISIDHKPDLKTEKTRIEKAGGHVIHSGCWRVGHPNIGIRLAVSRSFGDPRLKVNLPDNCTAPLVSSIPTIFHHKLSGKEDFLILASDGLWDRISDEDACKYVRRAIAGKSGKERGQCAAEYLVEKALEKRSVDNISVTVLMFNWKKVQEERQEGEEEDDV